VTDTSGVNDSPAPAADAPPQPDEQDDRTVEHRVPPSGWAYGPGAGVPPVAPPPSGPPPPAGPAPYGAPFGSPAPYGAPPPYGFAGPPTATLPPPGPPPPQARRGRGLGAIAVVALVTALLGGSVGGVVGYEAAIRRPPGPSAGVLGQPLPPADPNTAPLAPVEAVAARVLPSVVQLQVDGATVSGEGSGIVLGADGLLLTNNHVIEAAASGGRVVALFHDGTSAPAQIVGRDPSSDLAVLRAQGVSGLTPVALGNSDSVRVGQQVVAFGAPLGLGGTVTTGIISALDRAVSVGEESGASEATVLSALQTDAAINPGNSGGPLVDMQGALIGINSAIATTGAEGGSIGVGFSIPINQAKRVAEELERTGRATRPVLGVALAGRGRATNGAVIGQVEPGGPADQAGLRANEVVTRVDDRPVTNGNELVAAIRDHAPGDRVTLTVDGRRVPVTLGGQTG
jgi:putative serine protease PepD